MLITRMTSRAKAVVRIGLIGDQNDSVAAHAAIPRAFAVMQADQNVVFALQWLPTDRLASTEADPLAYDGLWCVPGGPYVNMSGALRAIRLAREYKRPFLGTCAGFQHALVEVARNVLGFHDADHAEVNPGAELPIVDRLGCALVGSRGAVKLVAGSRLAAIYGREHALEDYICSYGPNPKHLHIFESSALRFTALNLEGTPRAFELASHQFFVATLFQPELSALYGVAHPVVRAFARAAADYQQGR